MGREWWDKSVFSLPSWGKIARSSEMLMILLLHLYDVLSLNPNFPYILLQISISFYSITSLQLSFKIHSILVAFQSLETLLHPELLNRPTTNCNLRLSIQMLCPRNRQMPIRYDLNLSPTAIFGTRNNKWRNQILIFIGHIELTLFVWFTNIADYVRKTIIGPSRIYSQH